MNEQLNSNISGYDVTRIPRAPHLLFELGGGDSVVYVPSVERNEEDTGWILSWTNDGGLPNPEPVTIPDGVDGTDGTDGVTPSITMTASVDDTTGTPTVTVTKTGTDAAPNFALAFGGLKGEDGTDGEDGVTPSITASATVDNTTGTPSVTVTKSGTDAAPVFTFAFTGLKGETGATGATGPAGADGQDGQDGDPGLDGSAIWTTTSDYTTPNYTFNRSDLSGGVSGVGPKEGDIIFQNVNHRTFLFIIVSYDKREGTALTTYFCEITGATGAAGATGPAGPGVPSGGTAGQFLVKSSSTDYDTEWATIPAAETTGF